MNQCQTHFMMSYSPVLHSTVETVALMVQTLVKTVLDIFKEQYSSKQAPCGLYFDQTRLSTSGRQFISLDKHTFLLFSSSYMWII